MLNTDDGAKPARRAKKKKQKRAARPYKEVAHKYSREGLVQRHVGTTLATLQAVMDLDGADPMLAAAFKAHQEAVELAIGAPAS